MMKIKILIRYPFVIYLFLCTVGIVSQHVAQKEYINTVWDATFFTFYGGVKENYFSLPALLFYSVMFLGYTFVIQNILTSHLSNWFFYNIIRLGSLQTWFLEGAKILCASNLFVLTVLFFINVATGFFLNEQMMATLTVNPNISVAQLLFQFFINGFLQLSVILLLIFIVAWFSREKWINLVVLPALVVLLSLNQAGWLPIGLNSFAYMNEDWSGLLIKSSTLAFYLGIELVIVKCLCLTKIRIGG